MILLINREPLGGKGLTGPIWQFLFFKPLPRRLAKTSPFVILPYCNARWFCSSTESLWISGLIIIIIIIIILSLLLSAHLSSLSLVYTGTVLVLVYTVHVLIKIITIAGSAICDCWWFLTTTMFTLVGRISEQWKSRLGDKHTNFKKHPDRPRWVYFLFRIVITPHGNHQSLVTVWDAFPKKKLFLWLWSDRRMSGTFLQLCAHYRAVSRDLDVSSTQQCQWVEKEKRNRTS